MSSWRPPNRQVNGTTVGYDNIVCTDTFNNNGLCDAVFAFTGQGDIHATAPVRDLFDVNSNGPTVFDAAIEGGTFAYTNTTGSIHLTNLPWKHPGRVPDQLAAGRVFKIRARRSASPATGAHAVTRLAGGGQHTHD